MLPDFGRLAPYVWSAYGVWALVLVALVAWRLREAARVARLEAANHD